MIFHYFSEKLPASVICEPRTEYAWLKMNGFLPDPEFSASCVMCGPDSFSATADTLEELVRIVAVHLEYMRTHHEEYLHSHNGVKLPEGKYPENIPEILSSPLFQWAILRLVPFNKIFTLFKITPYPPLKEPYSPLEWMIAKS